jgi:hypothetical protein
MLLFVAVLFFLLTPGVLVRLPPKCTLLTCAAFHAVVFTIVYFLSCKFFWSLLNKNEYMTAGKEGAADMPPKNSKTDH